MAALLTGCGSSTPEEQLVGRWQIATLGGVPMSSMPGREKEVWDYYRNNANALAQLRAPIYEDKVIDFILELANVTEKRVTREELYKDEEDAAKSTA